MPEGNTCPNGHPANENGNCFTPDCFYRNGKRHDGVGR